MYLGRYNIHISLKQTLVEPMVIGGVSAEAAGYEVGLYVIV